MNDDANLDHLVDQPAIDTATARVTSARERLVKVTADLANAEAARVVAGRTAASAIAGDGNDPHAASAERDTAARAVDVATQVRTASLRALRTAEAGLAEATGIAHQGVYQAGVTARLAAARKADRAKEIMAEAERDYSEATDILNRATAKGTRHVVYDPAHSHKMTTYAAEFALWSQNYHTAWWPGLNEDGGVKLEG